MSCRKPCFLINYKTHVDELDDAYPPDRSGSVHDNVRITFLGIIAIWGMP
jgi:hypothetical protein